jgi:hypothetical protein
MNIYYLTQIYIPYKVSVTKFNIYIYIYIYIYIERERERERVILNVLFVFI